MSDGVAQAGPAALGGLRNVATYRGAEQSLHDAENGDQGSHPRTPISAFLRIRTAAHCGKIHAETPVVSFLTS